MADMIRPGSHAMHKRAAATLGVAALLLAFANAYVFVTPVDISPTDIAPGDGVAITETALADAPDRGDVTQTTARPLFSESRRPMEKVAEAVAPDAGRPAADAPEQLELRGLMKRGGRMQALIRSGDNLAGSWVPVGGSRDGLHVREVKGDVAVVEVKGQRYELPMKYRSVRTSDSATETRTP